MSDDSAISRSGAADDSEVDLLSRLLSDSVLRQRFRENSFDVIEELTDSAEAATFLSAINHEQLEAQAETLIGKRRHEVAQLMPLTFERLDGDADELFRSYVSDSPWPKGHSRHLRDAAAFGTWLHTRSPHEAVRIEWNRLCFAESGRTVSAHIMHHRPIRFVVQLLIRKRNGRVRQFLWNLGLPGRS